MVPYVRRQFPDVAPAAWEHPADAAALEALRAVPGFDRVVAWTFGQLNEWTMGQKLTAESVRATETSAPRLTRLFREVRLALDSPVPVELRVKAFGGINAVTTGVDRPLLVVATEAEAQLEDDQIKVILAHELGHILSGHVHYKMMLAALLQVGWSTALLPASLPVFVGVAVAMLHWERMSELSADRASALVVGGAAPVAATLRRAGGGPGMLWGKAQQLPPRWRPLGTRAARGAERVLARHPPVSERVASLEAWTRSEAWERMQGGDYPRRSERPRPGSLDGVRASLGRLRAGWRAMVDPRGTDPGGGD